MSQHEELEVGQHLDQTVRTALTGVAQLVERLSRSSAERDRAAAQAIREQLLQQRPRPETATRERQGGPGTVDGVKRASRDDEPTTARRPDPGGHAAPYYDAAAGEGAARTTAAWGAALRDLADDPAHPTAAAAATSLDEHARRRYGLDLAGGVAAAIGDQEANRGADRAETAARAAAAAEEAMVVLPAHRANRDRGVSPTKASTAEEATHRRQAWQQARTGWEQENRPGYGDDAQQLRQAWDALPMQNKTDRYWKEYDTEPARTVPTSSVRSDPRPEATQPTERERGLQPSKAPTAEERSHREEAWRMAQAAHRETLPETTSVRDARKAWDGLEWQEKALRYWTAYDDPKSRPAAAAAAPIAAGEVTRERVIELNEKAADYFAAQATPGSKGRTYLDERLGPDVVDHGPWRLGYAPSGWTKLTDHLRQGGATDPELVAAGLGRVSSRGTVVDAFRDRATVAVRGAGGEVLGFAGRDLSGDAAAPKYVNTGGTAAYTKGDHLLGLHEASPGARLVRVEGPFDAIAVSAAGAGRYAGVTPLGTALTAAQADSLAERAGGRVWQALDGDAAGSRAAESDFWMMRERGVDARLIPLPKDTDPAQLWRETPDQLRTLLEVADAAPTAGLAVVDNTVRDLEARLRNGEADAFDELAATQDRIGSGLPALDRVAVDTYTSTVVEDLRAQADTDRVKSARADIVDDVADVADAAGERSSDPGQAAHLGGAAQGARSAREGFGVRADDTDAAASREGVTYDRAAPVTTATVGDAEAVAARGASAPGFSQPTRDMLTDANTRAGSPARPATTAASDLGQRRTQRR